MSCPPGQILRDAHHRSSYTRADGTQVPSSNVSASCISDRGEPGKGPKTLPPLDGKLHLTNYGYSASLAEEARHRALRSAIRDIHSVRKVEQHLNLIRNYQADPKTKRIFSDDVDYLKKLYAKSKAMKGSLTGGDAELFVKEEKCDDDKCQQIITVQETHDVEGKEVSFYTLTEEDAEAVFKLDKEYLDSDITLEKVKEKLVKGHGTFIGLKVDKTLEAYCQYKLGSEAYLVWFCANKTYGTPLYQFMEKFFTKNEAELIQLTISLEGSYNIRRLNFWIHMGFMIDGINNEKHQLSAIKKLE